MKKYRKSSMAASVENSNHVLNIAVPPRCSSCGFGNFNIWGTVVGGRVSLEVRCMRCGKANSSLECVKEL